jgi:Fe-S-cluster containining protein
MAPPAPMSRPGAPSPTLDIELLRGFEFHCRPDCGLCCFAEPRVEPSERIRLLEIVPELEFKGSETDRFLAARSNGGACQLLSDQRCRAHAVRPQPCREFPLTAHLGERLQATVVLSCPGIDLSPLARPPSAGRAMSDSLRDELVALRERITPSTSRRLADARRRRRRLVRELTDQGRWEDERDVRERLESAVPRPTDGDFPVADPPSVDDGPERLPLFFDRRASPIALAAGLGGWELLELSPNGGTRRSWGVVPPPERRPRVALEAMQLLDGYLDYWLRRDALFGAVHLEMIEAEDGAPVSEWVASELRAIGALVLARADVRARWSRGEAPELTADDVADGIRATDQDLLDRPTWGDRL